MPGGGVIISRIMGGISFLWTPIFPDKDVRLVSVETNRQRAMSFRVCIPAASSMSPMFLDLRLDVLLELPVLEVYSGQVERLDLHRRRGDCRDGLCRSS